MAAGEHHTCDPSMVMLRNAVGHKVIGGCNKVVVKVATAKAWMPMRRYVRHTETLPVRKIV